MYKIIYTNFHPVRLKLLEEVLASAFEVHNCNGAFALIEYLNHHHQFDLVVLRGNLSDTETLQHVQKTMPYLVRLGKPVVLISDHFSFADKKFAVKEGISSIFEESDISNPIFFEELNKVAANPPLRIVGGGGNEIIQQQQFRYKTPLAKRIFDVIVSGGVLFFLSPVYGIIALLIRLESKGPIFYISKRVGAGYQIFDFYKFRTMVPDADKKLKQLSHLNQYATQQPAVETTEEASGAFVFCEECKLGNKECDHLLYNDSGLPVCEKLFLKQKREAKDTFFKISNDPRITKLGGFLRNSSLDEIPQLYNVFKGDMSIVGNRPLPLYEAEKLTNDMFTKRFLAPAGLTGLWQVTKRGKGGPMNEEERISLDNTYADHYGFWFDIKLILKTIPALFQKENV